MTHIGSLRGNAREKVVGVPAIIKAFSTNGPFLVKAVIMARSASRAVKRNVAFSSSRSHGRFWHHIKIAHSFTAASYIATCTSSDLAIVPMSASALT